MNSQSNISELNKPGFDGVFRFTNATDEDFTGFWNNKEYLFPAGTCCPIIIQDETLENIQEIRKKFAYKLATREFYKGSQYAKMSRMGNGLPPTFDEKILEPMIETCLKPLPIAQATVTEGKRDSEKNYRGSKAIGKNENIRTVFEGTQVESLGKMSNKEI